VGTAERAWKWIKRNPGRSGVIAAAILVLLGAIIAANEVRKQQDADRTAADQRLAAEQLAAEKQRADDRIAAEQNRQAAQRETRTNDLVEALASADTTGVPRLIEDLKEHLALLLIESAPGLKLREMAGQPVSTKPGLHARLALLTTEPARAAELAAYLPVCRADELLTLRQFLEPHAQAVSPALWAVLTDERAETGKRVRAACALAGLTPADARWGRVAPVVTELVVKENPLEVIVWARALEPVRAALVALLVERYTSARERIRGGKLDESALVAEVAAFDLTANLLARYTSDRPAELAELAVTVDARHYALFRASIVANKATVVPLLKVELTRPALSGPGAVSPFVGIPNPDALVDARAKRRGHAAAVLFTLGEAESVWALLVFPKDGDPSARSYLVQRLAAIGANPAPLVQRFGTETDVSAKSAILIALGDFPVDQVPAGEREPFVARLLTLYRDDPDAGLHSAIDWLLRQKWGKAKELAAIDLALAETARGRVVARSLAGAVAGPTLGELVGPLLPAPQVAVGKDWFVNGDGQTYAVVRGPVEFTMGSPQTEPDRVAVSEPPHQKRIGRTFAVATKEVTVEQFLRFRSDHEWVKRASPGPDTPAVAVTWYDCAAYCNWLSAREGIPEDQWCYRPNRAGKYEEGTTIKRGHLALTGYRLPTEAEWEFACRSGSTTARYYGRGEELLSRYGWFLKNADDRARPVGQLRPNERGLFDVLGNALEWTEVPGLLYSTEETDDKENGEYSTVNELMPRILRGAGFIAQPMFLRSATRTVSRPGDRILYIGFRPARTLRPEPAGRVE
jgi:formylglycine-generating enzyme required for sulfatase activity